MNRSFPCLSALALAAAFGIAPAAAQAQSPAKPNILVIWGDDIGQFNISAYNMGMMGYRTPNIDRVSWRDKAQFIQNPHIKGATCRS